MSDSFLYQLRMIRQRYGVGQTQMSRPQEKLINVNNCLVPSKLQQVQRAQIARSISGKRVSYHALQNSDYIKENHSRGKNERSFLNDGFSNNLCSINTAKTESFKERMSIPKTRSQSLQRVPLNPYNMECHQQNIPSVGHSIQSNDSKNVLKPVNFDKVDQLYHEVTLNKSRRVDTRNMGMQIFGNIDGGWSINNLCKVQDKIRSYLRR